MNYSWGPITTPSAIRKLIIITCLVTITSAFLESIFITFSQKFGPQEYLSLSWWGLKQGYLWQFITYLFIQDITSYGITFHFLFMLAFNMYILWTIGTTLIEFRGNKSFLVFYFTSGIFSGALALAAMPLTGYYAVFAGASGSLLAMIVAWIMLYPDLEILLFFLIPLKTKWLALGILGVVLLTTLSQWDIAYLIFYLTAIGYGYFYAALAWNLKSPFPCTHSFDRFLGSLRFFSAQNKDKDKIIDLKTGNRRLNDDEFVDAMLNKIARHGEKSLSFSEKKRLDEIAQTRRPNYNDEISDVE